jgi:hypothetical protein
MGELEAQFRSKVAAESRVLKRTVPPGKPARLEARTRYGVYNGVIVQKVLERATAQP